MKTEPTPQTDPRPDLRPDLRHGDPYRVPDGYFSTLRGDILDRVRAEAQAPVATVAPAPAPAPAVGRGFAWLQVRSLAGFAAAFAFLALVASVGFYFTGYRASLQQQAVELAQGAAADEDALLGYTIYSEDVEELLLTEAAMAANPTEAERQFDQAVEEYVMLYGSGLLAATDFTY